MFHLRRVFRPTHNGVLAGFRRNLAINLDPENLIYISMYVCTHLLDAVQDVALMQK